MQTIFLEAEAFQKRGGWVVDSQSMETLGSAYLMAHGMGEPVEDARTTFAVENPGDYKVWALTRDWTAEWGVKDPAGKFRVKVGETVLPHILGTNGKAWAWQFAGEIFLPAGKHSLALQDLTGFNGRCDAILLTDSTEEPKSDQKSIADLRRIYGWKEIVPCETTYDLIVVGGGIAGICTALAAFRDGVKTLLIHDREMLGGCNSSEVRVCMGGQINHPPYPALGNVVKEIAPVVGFPTIYGGQYFEDDRKFIAFEAEKWNYADHDILLHTAVTDLEMEGDRITAVICTDTLTGKKSKVRAKLFSDCSGDAVLARLAGAETMYGNDSREDFGEQMAPLERKKLVMGHSIRWYSEEQAEECAFPDLDWNLEFDESSYLNCFSGDWEQETGFTRDMVTEIEYIRDYGLRAIYANWSYQKNHCAEKEKFAKSKLQWVSPIGGKRESYRVKGDYVLTQHDIDDLLTHEDDTAYVTWGIDIHYPEPLNQEKFGEAFRSFAYHRGMPAKCPVPYRCLYSKDIANLFLGGRLVSTSHVAFSALRVMRTLGMLGEVVGMAAAICTQKECLPRQVYTQHLEELKAKMTAGVHIPVAFAGNGIGDSESYHFKDLGWWRFHNGECADNFNVPRTPTPAEIEKFYTCVKKLGLEHQYPIPEKWIP